MVKRRVVVTGLGAVTPIGNNIRDVWESIEGSQSGITRITKFDASNYASQIAGEVKNFNSVKFIDEEASGLKTFLSNITCTSSAFILC